MKIGISCYPVYGGSGVVATELGIELAKRGHEGHFITYAPPFRLSHFVERIYYHEVEVPQYALFEHPPYNLALSVAIQNVAATHGLDLLHAHYAVPHATSAWLAKEMLGNSCFRIITTLHGTDITLVGQDWGGLIGLRLVAAEPDRFARVVVANTGLPPGEGTPSEAFLSWQDFAATTESFPVGAIINGGCTTDLPAEVIAAYDAPFPDDTYKAGARAMPSLVPTSPDDPAHEDQVAAWNVLEGFDKPLLCAFSDSDPITGGGHRVFERRVPGASGQPHTTIEGGGHFLQEDSGPELARVVADFIAG